MPIFRSGRVGLALLAAGAILMLAGSEVGGFETSAGHVLFQMLRSTNPPLEPATMARLGGAVLGLVGASMAVLDMATGRARGRTPEGRKILFSGHDHDTVPERSFTHYDFSLAEPADLACTVEVLNDQPVNVIVTSAEYRDRFTRTFRIRKLEDLTAFDAKRAEIEGRLEPGEWSVIVDNTNRLGLSKRVTGTAEIRIEYEVVAAPVDESPDR